MFDGLLKIFIDGVVRYFEHIPDQEVTVGVPFIVENSEPVVYEYTGLIGISGSMKGSVYFSAPKVLLEKLLLLIGEENTYESNVIDIVGEIANTISGNARRELGKDFVISVPAVIADKAIENHLPEGSRSYVIPVNWQSFDCVVVIAFKNI